MAYPVCPRHGAVPMQWQPSGIPFEGTSEARAAYTPKQLQPPSGFTGEAPTRPKIPFSGESTYRSDFKPHVLCPLHAPEGYDPASWRPSGVPFDGTTTSREAYGVKPLEPRQYEPAPQYRPSTVPFQGTSEARAQYQPWELPRRGSGSGEELMHPPRPHIPFTGTSTARDAYTPKALEPRPTTAMPEYKPSSVPFAGSTEAREQYKAWDLPARPTYDPSQVPERPRIPFEGRSTAQEAYTPKQLERPGTGSGGSYAYVAVPDTRDFKSEASAAHGWKAAELPCPAALLPPPPAATAGAWKGEHAMWDPVKRRWLHSRQ